MILYLRNQKAHTEPTAPHFTSIIPSTMNMKMENIIAACPELFSHYTFSEVKRYNLNYVSKKY